MAYLHTFVGCSGRAYQFHIADKHHVFGDNPGIYALVYSTFWPRSLPRALYIGKTVNARFRPGANAQNHEKKAAASSLGFNQIGFLVERSETGRLKIEEDLIRGLNPPLNQQHRNALSGIFGLRSG